MELSRAQLLTSGLFKTAWYLRDNPDVVHAGMDAADHYVRFGCHEDRRPNPYFEPSWYRSEYPDTACIPLLHYLLEGERNGCRPMPLFDPIWYRASNGLASDESPLAHFLVHRMTGRYPPCARLFAVPLVPPYRDDPASGVDPFLHYLEDGGAGAPNAALDASIVRNSGLLDLNYYLIQGSDVHAAAIDPAVHFCIYGWREGRKPNPYFDPGWYMRTNPVVQGRGINPLVHYILLGEAEDRRPVPYFSPRWYRRRYAVRGKRGALEHFLAHRRKQRVSPTPLFEVTWYIARHSQDIGPSVDPFAHFLQRGTWHDVDPGPDFDMALYRQQHLGRSSKRFRGLMTPEASNPLVHHLRSEYR